MRDMNRRNSSAPTLLELDSSPRAPIDQAEEAAYLEEEWARGRMEGRKVGAKPTNSERTLEEGEPPVSRGRFEKLSQRAVCHSVGAKESGQRLVPTERGQQLVKPVEEGPQEGIEGSMENMPPRAFSRQMEGREFPRGGDQQLMPTRGVEHRGENCPSLHTKEMGTPDAKNSGASSPSVDLTPFLSGTRGPTTPMGRAVSARRHLPFGEEETPSPIFTTVKRPRGAQPAVMSGNSLGSAQFA